MLHVQGPHPPFLVTDAQVLTDVLRHTSKFPDELDGELGEELAFQVCVVLYSGSLNPVYEFTAWESYPST